MKRHEGKIKLTDGFIPGKKAPRSRSKRANLFEKITVTNSFHCTSCTIKTLVSGPDLLVTESQAKKTHDQLCGSETCLCGNSLGQFPVPTNVTPTAGGYLIRK